MKTLAGEFFQNNGRKRKYGKNGNLNELFMNPLFEMGIDGLEGWRGIYKMLWYEIKSLISIDEFDRITTQNRHPDRTMSLWTLGIVVKGSRSIEVQDTRIFVKKGEYFLLPPGVWQRGIEEEWHDVYYFHFHMDCRKVDKIEKCQRGKMWISLCGKLPVDIDILSLVMALHRDFKLQYLSDDALKAHLASILYSLSAASMKKQYSQNRNNIIAEQLLQYIVDNIEKKHSALELETRFGMSYRRLNSIFKGRYDVTIHQCVLEKKMQHAFHLLILGEKISSAAILCGYEDYFYFLKVFKKIYGMTPKDCRQQYLTDNK